MDAKTFVIERLQAPGRPSLKEIAASAGVGESWLRMFARGEIPDPSYSRIKALSDYFMRAPASEQQQAAWGRSRRQHGGGNGSNRQQA